jgi:hypothetical protein
VVLCSFSVPLCETIFLLYNNRFCNSKMTNFGSENIDK